MITVSGKEVIIKVVWNKLEDNWGAVLLTSKGTEHQQRPLRIGEKIDIEVTNKRKCIGYIGEDGRVPCPDFADIESGQQCYQCRNNDIHIDYVEGRSGSKREGKHSVYLVQIGNNVKVGVTRTRRLMRRWVEQGAMYATEIEVCEDADKALEIESKISSLGVKERIGKKKKSQAEDVGHDQIESVMDDLDQNGSIVNVQSKTIYDNFYDFEAFRDGKIVGEIDSVRGQLIFASDQCLAVTRGKCIQEPSQRSITDF